MIILMIIIIVTRHVNIVITITIITHSALESGCSNFCQMFQFIFGAILKFQFLWSAKMSGNSVWHSRAT